MEIKEKTALGPSVGADARKGDYYIPCITLDEETQPIGVWGRRYLQYIGEHRRGFYTGLLLSGKLNGHVAEIDRQAEAVAERLMTRMAEQEGITETLKEENQMEWVGRMNNLRQRVTEIVNSELVYA